MWIAAVKSDVGSQGCKRREQSDGRNIKLLLKTLTLIIRRPVILGSVVICTLCTLLSVKSPQSGQHNGSDATRE